MARYVLDVNGQSRSIHVPDPRAPLHVLRIHLSLTGPKMAAAFAQALGKSS